MSYARLSMTAVLLSMVLSMSSARRVFGVLVASTTDNTTRPADDPGWDNIGILNGSTAIYLGNKWVLAPAHVGRGTVRFPERGTFESDANSVYRVQNPRGQGLTADTDMLLFQLTEDPGLPPLQVATDAPVVGTQVLSIGYGKNREDNITYWEVDTRFAKWVWTESDEPADYAGYGTIGTNSLRWGTNLLESDEPFFAEFDSDNTTVVNTSGDVIAFITEFDDAADPNSDDSVKALTGSSSTPFEYQAVLNDSGAATFYKDNSMWRLAGMIVAVEGHAHQPDERRTAIFGNLTFHADLSEYADQIQSRYIRGDFDEDGELDADDIDLMTAGQLSQEYDAMFDLNRDGVDDIKDRKTWVESIRFTYFGDSNLDGQFNTRDLIKVLQSGQYEDDIAQNSTWATGDWNGDLEFGSGDFIVALQTLGFEQGPRAAIPTRSASLVPEPAGASHLAFVGLLLGFALRRDVCNFLQR